MTTGGFESPEWTTHTTGNWTQSTSEGTWSAGGTYVNTGTTNSGSNKFGMNTANDFLITPAYTDPCELSYYVRTSSDPDNWSIDVQYSASAAGPWTTLSTITENGVGGTITDTYTQIVVPVNLIGTYYFQFYMTSNSTGSAYIDDISLTCSCAPPTNTITTGALSSTSFTLDCNVPTNGPGNVQFTSTGTFGAGNIYTVQLSDAAGNFSTPTNIGSLGSNSNSGTINFTIPASMPSGVGYLIRIISDDPAAVGTTVGPITITQLSACIPQTPTTPGLIINEWSNGISGTGTGNREYYEFVVAGQCGATADIRGYILDDNNGTFSNLADYNASNATGIAPGHFRFTYDPQWAAVPVGSLIVVYNEDDINPALPPADPSDANNDSLYVIPHTSVFFERCTTFPDSPPPDSIYSPCTYATSPLNGWNPLSLRNSGDAIQVRNPDGSYFHGVSYGGSEMTGGPHNLKLFTGSGSSMCGWFNDGDFFDINNWSSGSTGANETPGLPNNALNYAWLKLMRDPNSVICPIIVLPVEIVNFDGFKLSNKNQLVWETGSELNSGYFIVERSVNGENWELVGETVAAGYSNERLLYRMDDLRFNDEVNYYRLIEVDINGDSKKYAKIVAIDNRGQIKNPVVARYNLMGQSISEDFVGVQILLYQDGTTEKVVNF